MESQEKSGAGLKICGVRRESDVAFLIEKGVSYVGFNFYPESPRYVTPAVAAEAWRQAVQKANSIRTLPVALTCDAPMQWIEDILTTFPEISVWQLHGTESPETRRSVRAVIGRERQLWQAVRIGTRDELLESFQLRSAEPGVIDMVLLDAKKGDVLGGSGSAFDWSWFSQIPKDPGLEFALAGGIQSNNLREALLIAPKVVDVCSGVESSRGEKDRVMMERLIESWRKLGGQ